MAKAIQACAAHASLLAQPAFAPPATYAIQVRQGAVLRAQPDNLADAVATLRDLLVRGADFEAGPLGLTASDIQASNLTPDMVFNPCDLSRMDGERAGMIANPDVRSVSALLVSAFNARITDTVRPMNASYGALHSWHKFGQAVDFVPRGGLNTINRPQIRALMAAHGIHLIELLGPGDPGHSNHWHVAFARAGGTDFSAPDRWAGEVDDEWHVSVPATETTVAAETSASPSVVQVVVDGSAPLAPPSAHAAAAPPSWDVFAVAKWRQSGGGS